MTTQSKTAGQAQTAVAKAVSDAKADIQVPAQTPVVSNTSSSNTGVTIPNSTVANLKQKAKEIVSSDSFIPTVAVTGIAYAALELVHHFALQGYVLPYLTGTLAVTGVTLNIVTGFVLVAAVAAVGYGIYRFFVKPTKEAAYEDGFNIGRAALVTI